MENFGVLLSILQVECKATLKNVNNRVKNQIVKTQVEAKFDKQAYEEPATVYLKLLEVA